MAIISLNVTHIALVDPIITLCTVTSNLSVATQVQGKLGRGQAPASGLVGTGSNA